MCPSLHPPPPDFLPLCDKGGVASPFRVREEAFPRVVRVLSAVKGAADAFTTPVEDVGVDHGRGDVFMAEQFLNGADVVAVFEEMGEVGLDLGNALVFERGLAAMKFDAMTDG